MRVSCTALVFLAALACLLPGSEWASAQPETCRLEDHTFADDVKNHLPSTRLTNVFKRTSPKLWFWFTVRCPDGLEVEPEFEVVWFRDTGGPLGSAERTSPSLRLSGNGGVATPHRLYDAREAGQLSPGSKWIVVVRFRADGVCNGAGLCWFKISVES